MSDDVTLTLVRAHGLTFNTEGPDRVLVAVCRCGERFEEWHGLESAGDRDYHVRQGQAFDEHFARLIDARLASERAALAERAEQVLAEHVDTGRSFVGTGHGTMGSGKLWCGCGEVIEFDWYAENASDAHRRHVAQVLARSSVDPDTQAPPPHLALQCQADDGQRYCADTCARKRAGIDACETRPDTQGDRDE